MALTTHARSSVAASSFAAEAIFRFSLDEVVERPGPAIASGVVDAADPVVALVARLGIGVVLLRNIEEVGWLGRQAAWKFGPFFSLWLEMGFETVLMSETSSTVSLGRDKASATKFAFP